MDTPIEDGDIGATEEDILGANSEIATRLKQFYTAIQEQEIPPHFLKLLEQLDEAEAKSHAAIPAQDEANNDRG